jgi:pimeloyl-ACP methyl ester carboxylesterase
MSFPAPRRVTLPARKLADGREVPPLALAVHEAGSGPAVVFSHGFPELAYSWRRQFPPLVEAGFHAIAPDQRGYGGSDRPQGSERYDIHHLTSDLVALLDALGVDRAVFVGHDWGGFVTWAMPILHPDRVLGVVGVNTPYLPRTPVPPTQLMRAAVGGVDERMYIVWFQQPGVAEAHLDPRARVVFDRLMRHPLPPAEAMQRALAGGVLDLNPFRRIDELETTTAPLLPPEELDVFVRAFERTGFGGGIDWYRNFDRNWETAPQVGVAKIEVPSLMITAEWDMALRPELAAGMPALVPDLEMHQIARCGHWTQQEQPDELNRILVDWLRRRFGAR